MPVKRRKSKARPDELKAWGMWFLSGHDFFDDLVDAGIVPHHATQPDPAIALDAWQRCGDAWLEQYAAEQAREKYPREEPPHAVEVFGMPSGRKRRAG